VFARTRADVAEIADVLSQTGLAVAPLSGELEQRERTRALEAFKRGVIRVLVATDVAARGIDVPEIDLVIHVQPPRDIDDYTHRSGRTGRAGRKGISAVLVSPRELPSTRHVLAQGRLHPRTAPVPTAATIRRAQDERIIATFTAADAAPVDERTAALARRLVESGDPEITIARLLAQVSTGPEPREIQTFEDRPAIVRPAIARPVIRSPRAEAANRDWILFQVSWGQRNGADPRRLLALVCRRGKITSQAVGGIRVGPNSSEIQIAGEVAATFADATREPDPRDPRVKIRLHPRRTA
jgi:ATP-dependent RNA helicase DeaD